MSLTERKEKIEIFKYCATSACVIVLYKVKIFKSSFPEGEVAEGGHYPSYLFHVNVSTIRWKMSDTPRLSRKREGWRLNGPLSPTDLAPPAQTRRILLGTLNLGSTNNEGKYIYIYPTPSRGGSWIEEHHLTQWPKPACCARRRGSSSSANRSWRHSMCARRSGPIVSTLPATFSKLRWKWKFDL